MGMVVLKIELKVMLLSQDEEKILTASKNTVKFGRIPRWIRRKRRSSFVSCSKNGKTSKSWHKNCYIKEMKKAAQLPVRKGEEEYEVLENERRRQ